MKKSVIQNIITALPEEIDLQKFVYKLAIIDKIEKGLNDVEKRRTLPISQVKKYFTDKWTK